MKSKGVILLAEDQKADAELFQFALRKIDPQHELHIESDGEKLLSVLKTIFQVDCVVLDMLMPKLNGLETARIIRKNPAWHGIKLILFGGTGSQEDQLMATEAGIDLYLAKPIDLNTYYSAINQILDFCSRSHACH